MGLENKRVAAIAAAARTAITEDTMTNDDFYAACRTVLRSAKDGYAKAYANAGLGLSDEGAISVQCLYILNNLGDWRGEEARATKLVFKQFSLSKQFSRRTRS